MRRTALACSRCGARSKLWVVYHWVPASAWHPPQFAAGFYNARVKCLDSRACSKRCQKRSARSRVRSGRLELAKPPGNKVARSKPGMCSWCGEVMWRPDKPGVVDARRGYHRGEYGERDCRSEKDASYTYDARWAIRYMARAAGVDVLACVDCGVMCEQLDERLPTTICVCGHERGEHVEGERMAAMHRSCEVEGCSGCAGTEREPWRAGFRAAAASWEADHEVPLEDGGEHQLGNLRCRCAPCHRAKTGRENSARARARQE